MVTNQPAVSADAVPGALFELGVETAGPVQCSVRAAGELDLAAAGQLDVLLEQQLAAGCRFARLDLSAVTFVDCACLGVLVAAHLRFVAVGGALLLTGVGPSISKMLMLTGLDRTLLTAAIGLDHDEVAGAHARVPGDRAAHDSSAVEMGSARLDRALAVIMAKCCCASAQAAERLAKLGEITNLPVGELARSILADACWRRAARHARDVSQPSAASAVSDRQAGGSQVAGSERRLETAASRVAAMPSTGPAGPPARAVGELVASAEPGVVFASLSRLCVPALADACTVTIVEEGGPGHRITIPDAGDEHRHADTDAPPAGAGRTPALARGWLRAPVDGIPDDGRPGYHGMLYLHWDDPDRPTDLDVAVAELAVDHAVNIVHRERLAASLAAARANAENLQLALASNRDIGAAIGILMTRRLITGRVAFELLRDASQNHNRKLREIAADVIQTGELPSSTARAGARFGAS